MDDAKLHQHRRSDGQCYYSCRRQGDIADIAISGNPDLVCLLARRVLIQKEIKVLAGHIRRLTRLQNNAEEARLEQVTLRKLKRYSDAGLDLCRIIFTEEQNEWINQSYVPNPYHTENLRYPTAGGIYTRSKSEAKLGTTLERLGIPFRYDDLVTIQSSGYSGSKPFRDTYFADFKLPNFNMGITVHEHLGTFQLDNYSVNALRRLNDYHSFTVIELPGQPVSYNEFTWSFENDLMNTERTHSLIRKMLLPRQ